jgi:hypothetical protein
MTMVQNVGYRASFAALSLVSWCVAVLLVGWL